MGNNIVIIYSDLKTKGGAERVALAFAKACGSQALILTHSLGDTYTEFRRFNIVYLKLKVLGPLKPFIEWFISMIYLLRKKPRLVIVTTECSYIVPAFISLFKPKLDVIHYVYFPHKPSLPQPFASLPGIVKRFLLEFLLKIYIRRVKVLYVSKHVKKKAISTYEYGEVLYPPLIGIFRPNPKVKRERFTILLPARFDPFKRHEVALQILTRLIGKYPNVRLIFAGFLQRESKFTQYYTYLHSLVREMGLQEFVIFKVNISDQELLELYQKSRVVIFCNPEERFGITPVEAQACGTPVVALEGGGVSETVINERTGFLCKNIDEMVEKLDLLLKDDELWTWMSENAVAHANSFREENFIKKFQDYLKRIKVLP
jgi:glycosyltransferase involved in cell wall biosynthesis